MLYCGVQQTAEAVFRRGAVVIGAIGDLQARPDQENVAEPRVIRRIHQFIGIDCKGIQILIVHHILTVKNRHGMGGIIRKVHIVLHVLQLYGHPVILGKVVAVDIFRRYTDTL